MKFHLDTDSGVPFYRQIIEQVQVGIARGSLQPGDQLPTVRRLAVDLSINPNTVLRAYRQLEIEKVLQTQQGSGTFVGPGPIRLEGQDRQRILDQIITEMLARGSAYGFSLDDILRALNHSKETPT